MFKEVAFLVLLLQLLKYRNYYLITYSLIKVKQSL
jgi:hypothetical protein